MELVGNNKMKGNINKKTKGLDSQTTWTHRLGRRAFRGLFGRILEMTH